VTYQSIKKKSTAGMVIKPCNPSSGGGERVVGRKGQEDCEFKAILGCI
jgi:hypothetical protein